MNSLLFSISRIKAKRFFTFNCLIIQLLIQFLILHFPTNFWKLIGSHSATGSLAAKTPHELEWWFSERHSILAPPPLLSESTVDFKNAAISNKHQSLELQLWSHSTSISWCLDRIFYTLKRLTWKKQGVILRFDGPFGVFCSFCAVLGFFENPSKAEDSIQL